MKVAEKSLGEYFGMTACPLGIVILITFLAFIPAVINDVNVLAWGLVSIALGLLLSIIIGGYTGWKIVAKLKLKLSNAAFAGLIFGAVALFVMPYLMILAGFVVNNQLFGNFSDRIMESLRGLVVGAVLGVIVFSIGGALANFLKKGKK